MEEIHKGIPAMAFGGGRSRTRLPEDRFGPYALANEGADLPWPGLGAATGLDSLRPSELT